MPTQKIKANKRKITGRKVKSLRKQGILPGNIYGKKIESSAIEFDYKELEKVYKDAGETGVVEIALGSKTFPTLIHNLQKDPVTDKVLHVDFLNVNLKEKVQAKVPVEVEGVSPAEKSGLGTAVQQVSEIEVEALPTDIPEKFTVDISKLEKVEDAIFVKDLKVHKNVEIKENPEKLIINIQPLQKEEVVVAAPKEEVTTEGEAPKEGTAAQEETKPAEETPKE